jgi:hypothetical protein
MPHEIAAQPQHDEFMPDPDSFVPEADQIEMQHSDQPPQNLMNGRVTIRVRGVYFQKALGCAN